MENNSEHQLTTLATLENDNRRLSHWLHGTYHRLILHVLNK